MSDLTAHAAQGYTTELNGTAAAYFDLCAARIRAMRPVKVRLWDGQEPPAELQVCR